MSKGGSWQLAAVVLVLAALMLTPVLFFEEQVEAYFAGEAGLQRVREFGPWAWLAGIVLIISDLFLPMPSTTVIAGLGMLYGPFWGGVVGGIGSLAAGLVAYCGCRLLGERVLHKLVGKRNLDRMHTFFERHGLWAIALSRWMPLLPELLCCLAGMAKMQGLRFVAALSCGSFAMGFAFAFLGTSYLEQPINGLLLSAAIPLLIWPILHLSLPPAQPALEAVKDRPR